MENLLIGVTILVLVVSILATWKTINDDKN